MNISLSSIRRRVSLAFISILVLVLFPIAYLTIEIKSIYETSQYLKENVKELQSLGNSLENTLNQSFSYLILYELYRLDSAYQTSSYQNKALQLLQTSQQDYQKIIRIEQKIPSQYAFLGTKVKIREINDNFEKLSEKYDLLTNVQNLKTFIYNQISPLHYKLDNSLAEFIEKEREREKEIQKHLKQRIEKLSTYVFGLFLITFILALLVLYVLLKPIFDDLTVLKKYIHSLTQGNLTSKVLVKNNELKEVSQDIESIIGELRKVKTFSQNKQISPFYQKGELGESFTHIQESIQKVFETEKIRDWQNKGVNLLAETVRRHNRNIEDLCVHFLESLVEHTKSVQAAIFIHNMESNLLELQAAFAYSGRRHIKKQKEIGEDLVSEVFRDGEIIFLNDIPEDYLEIRSGLGKAQAKCIVLVPLKSQNVTVGVLELASFDIFEGYQIEVLERVGAILAAAIDTVISSKQTQDLLSKAQVNSRKITEKEEKLRAQAAELLLKQQILEKNNRNLSIVSLEQKQFFDNNLLGLIIIDKIGRIEKLNTAASNLFGYSNIELKRVFIKKLIPELKDWSGQYREDEKNRYFRDYQALRKRGEEFFVQVMINQLGQGNHESYSITVTRSQPDLFLKMKGKI